MPGKSFPSKSPFVTIIWITVGFMIAFVLYLPTQFGFRKDHYMLALFALTAGLFYYPEYKKKYESQFGKIIFGILIFVVIKLLFGLALTYLHIPQWDFMCYYLFGKVGIVSSDFYNPAVFSRVFNDLHLQTAVTKGFIIEIVNTGFWYPPSSMFLFLPLGLLDLKTGYAIWQSLVIFFLLTDIILLTRYYSLRINANYKSTVKVFLVMALILFFPEINGSILYGQTMTLFLFLLILLIRRTDNYKSGIFLALLVVIKPLAAFFVLFYLFSGKWKTITSFLLTGTLILAGTIVFFGYGTLLNYFISPPTGRMPAYVFYEDINQSLNGVLLRLHNNFFTNVPVIYFKSACYFLSFSLIAITIYASRILAKVSASLSFMIYIPMTLLVYPGTLGTYMIILLPVVLTIFNQKLFCNDILNLVLIIFLYGIGFYSLFLFSLLLWTTLVAWTTVKSMQPNIFFPPYKAFSRLLLRG